MDDLNALNVYLLRKLTESTGAHLDVHVESHCTAGVRHPSETPLLEELIKYNYSESRNVDK